MPSAYRMFIFLVPKLGLGTPSAKLRFAPLNGVASRRETEFREMGSQTEFGNQKISRRFCEASLTEITSFRRGRSPAHRPERSDCLGFL